MANSKCHWVYTVEAYSYKQYGLIKVSLLIHTLDFVTRKILLLNEVGNIKEE